MPELPDVVVYLERLRAFTQGHRIEGTRLASPFLVRSFDPPLSTVHGKQVRGFRRIGKRIVFELEDDLFMVVHLMIAGRLRWRPPAAPVPRKVGLMAFDFAHGSLLFTEAATKKRASLYVVRGDASLTEFERGGVEPLAIDREQFEEALLRENRTLKRALTDPRIFSGIGNAYSDEILFRAALSPVKRTRQLKADEIDRLFEAVPHVLTEWIERLRQDVGEAFPDKVTAFRPEMAVHGKYKEPCPSCGTRVQRIRFESNEVNYCPRCQTGGKVLADRSLSRLLRGEWPKSIEELEELEAQRTPSGAKK